MGKKENRPDACTASGTASTCDYDSTSVYAGQDMTENELIRTVTEEYLAGIDVDICPAPEQVERGLLQATNNAIEAYNRGPRDPNAPVGASLKDAYPDQKPPGDARLRLRKHLDPYQIALIVRELHHAVGILWKDAGDDGNFDIGVYQTSGDNEGTYDVSEDGLTRLIRSYDSAITIRGVYETIAVLRSVCPHVERCHDRDLKVIFCDFPNADIPSKVYQTMIRTEGKKYGLKNHDLLFTSEIGYPDGFPRQGVFELFQLSNLFICPSYSESFGLTVLEAASRGNFLVLNEAVPALKELGEALGAYFMRWDARNFGFDTRETYSPSERAYYEEHGRKIVDLMREDRSLHAKTIVRNQYNDAWICRNQLLPLLKE